MLTTEGKRQALPPVQGTVLRVQLDGMIGALPHIEVTTQQGDPLAVRLLVCLMEARQAAAEIEARGRAQPLYRGVRL